jgi:hypothetical protein
VPELFGKKSKYTEGTSFLGTPSDHQQVCASENHREDQLRSNVPDSSCAVTFCAFWVESPFKQPQAAESQVMMLHRTTYTKSKLKSSAAMVGNHQYMSMPAQ